MGADDDSDRDGQSNFVEFATGTDPTKANAPAKVDFWIESGLGGTTLFLRYWRHILATRMVKYEILMSDELKSWIDNLQRFTETGEIFNGNGYVERVTLSYPLTGEPPPRQFVRLKLTPIIPWPWEASLSGGRRRRVRSSTPCVRQTSGHGGRASPASLTETVERYKPPLQPPS